MNRLSRILCPLALAICIGSAEARVDWIRNAEDAIRIARLDPVAARSAMSIVRAAMAQTEPVAYREAAASLAAFIVLECMFPERQAQLETDLAVDLADYPETDMKAAALAQGRRMGNELLASPGLACGHRRDFDARDFIAAE